MSSSVALDPRHGIGRMALRPAWLAAALWLLACGVMLLLFRGDIPRLNFMDTDDAMRLQQVRDWIGGQGWFDVSQHRINPPTGGPMHWSRLVDMPIAGIILLARPFMGQVAAEMLAIAIVPLFTLGLLCIALFHAARRLAGPHVALFAQALLLLTPTIMIQFPPTRIDHHGWQILMATIALAGALDSRRLRGGLVAGAAMASWLQISTEGLPYAALFGALFVLRQWIDAGEAPRLRAFAGALGLGALLLLAATRGAGALVQTQCDALSGVYAWPLLAFAVIVVSGPMVPGGRSFRGRLIVPAVGGAVALGLLLWIGADCLTAGPFHELTPLAYEQWYMQVKEGRPLWEQSASIAGVALLPSLFGIAATIMAVRDAKTTDTRVRWGVMAVLLIGASMISLMVLRAMSVAHVFALPGTAWLLAHLFHRAQALPFAFQRVLLSVGLALLTPVGLSSAWASAISATDSTPEVEKTNCRNPGILKPLDDLPPSLLFAPLDIGPDILVRTPHSIIGTGHHRNVIGINLVTHAFLSPPDAARADVMSVGGGRGADYLVLCPRMNEVLLYAGQSPGNLAARLTQGQVPDWLERLPGKGPLQIYRVMRP